jgi:hypothetical protein
MHLLAATAGTHALSRPLLALGLLPCQTNYSCTTTQQGGMSAPHRALLTSGKLHDMATLVLCQHAQAYNFHLCPSSR